MSAVTLVDLSSSASHAGDSSCNSNAAPQSSQFNIIQLPEPGSDDTCNYIIVTQQQSPNYDIYEVQSVRPNCGKYASYFVGSRIISNPELYVTTRVDPLFFALSHFYRIVKKGDEQSDKLDKWQPWDQALADLPLPILRALGLDPTLTINGIKEVGQLGHLLDVSDMCGDDLLLCKFSEESALKWLVAKFNQALEALRTRQLQRNRRDLERREEMDVSGGAKSSSFNMVTEEDTVKKKEEEGTGLPKQDSERIMILSSKEEESLRAGSLQLICDYIPAEWRQKLTKELGMEEADWKGKSKTSAANNEEKPERASWEGNHGQEDADALLAYTMGTSNASDKSSSASDNKNGTKNAQSAGLKRLAKVNKKGMKSLSSFFGGAKKKQKKS
mmetsp:Transcript_4318/g.6624  ORF Transcript_4318/g.6624 Transcript_4318/m.6624 type:complete len:387 (+) Transcript_4318:41-1201(+)